MVQPCWLSAAKVLELEVVRLQTSWPPVNVLETQGELGSLVYAMTQLSSRFPLLGAPSTVYCHAMYSSILIQAIKLRRCRPSWRANSQICYHCVMTCCCGQGFFFEASYLLTDNDLFQLAYGGIMQARSDVLL